MKFVLPCENVYDEAATVANKICDLVANGARFRDIVVVICDYEDTAPIFTQVLQSSQIPVNVDVGMKLIETVEGKYLRDLLNNSPWVKERLVIKNPTVVQICKQLSKFATEEKIIEILDVVTKTLGDQKITVTEFSNMFCTLLTATKISDVPANLDRVMLVGAKEYEPTFIPHVFIAGATAFPAPVPDTDIITEQDIRAMKIHVEPTATLQATRAWRHAINIMQSATQGLYISYSAINVRGEHATPTPLAHGFPIGTADIACRSFAKTRVLAGIGNGEAFQNNETAEYLASVKTASDMADFKIPQLDKQPANVALDIDKISVTALEDYAKCPYYFYLTRVLKLKPFEPPNAVAPHVVGTILHTFAERFVREGAPIEAVLRDYKLPNYMTRAIKKCAKQIANYLTESIATRDFKPKYFEHEIDGELDGVKVRGKVDRIDAHLDQLHVVDYKSGGAGVIRLQVPLYMHFLGATGGEYLNLKELKPREVRVDEIAPAVARATDLIADIKRGKITREPAHKDVCKYCPNRGMCEVKL